MRETPGLAEAARRGQGGDPEAVLPAARLAALASARCWIVGGGTGYGRALALALAARGAQVVVSGRRPGPLDEVVDASAGAVTAAPLDALEVEAWPAPLDPLRDQDPAGPWWLVVAAALPGGGSAFPLLGDDPGRGQAVLRTNLEGSWRVARAFLRGVLGRPGAAGAEGGGEAAPSHEGPAVRVLLLSSRAGWAETPGLGTYNVSKCGVNALGCNLAAEAAEAWPGADVQVNVLAPGQARTEMNQGSEDDPACLLAPALALLTYPAGGPSGHHFTREGEHLAFGPRGPWWGDLLGSGAPRVIFGPDGALDRLRARFRARMTRWLGLGGSGPLPGPPPRLLGAEGDCNLVAAGGRVFALPGRLGPVDLTRVDPTGWPGVVVGPDRAAVVEALRRRAAGRGDA